MGFRTVYGNTISENGWPMVDEGSCTWVNIPGTDVTLEIQNGQSLQIMRAFAADFHAYIEPLRDADSACWTLTNDVDTSNHLSGTAMDLNWDSHPFQVADAGFDAAKLARVRALLDFYEGTIYWGNDWTSPKDAMHFQMGYGTYGNPATADFIRRKIRADGYSTYQRGAAPAAASVLAQATGLSASRAAVILPAVQDGLAAADCTNVNRIAMWLAQIGHESDNFNATEEYANGDMTQERWIYKGRTWIQLTWKSNYAGFSQWCYDRGLVATPTYFVDNPTALADLKWAGLGAAWYWTVARPDINALADARDLVTVTLRINGGTNGLEDSNGKPGRRTRYNRALAVGDALLTLINPEGDDDFMSELTAAEQRELLDNTRWLREQLGPNIWGPASSFGKDEDGKELTLRDGLAALKRSVEMGPGVSAEQLTEAARAEVAALAKSLLADLANFEAAS
ncbi:M15 family metallopeptidase [Mycobacterium intracellulare]|uniref:M15 family metallopeptidase n=1 Tax=Mycobacterium intracellulare TaxID=1767 RepID=A0AAE4R965_MYCIT|nr:M15 family metallopeptidase [Mycobacterium intracellulare]MDV6975324.1 M15 family metallopeptidase [Mycobacterium intracellulare]MDV6980388.1 M15 family metallopeptidase [Mycobacterium intracellulare]MDV7010817.1 M15 family metallopeptidase [Mycobacterium intracellulare]MDV7025723.1 M15 family metallopeptidase [Mycobacterium intracellulare]